VAILRVEGRVQDGGHNVPPMDIRRRFERSAKNFFSAYRLMADRWIIYDNSREFPKIVAFRSDGKLHIIRKLLYRKLVRAYGTSDDDQT
jgi:predicted ABC-type ATPase